MIKFVLIPLSDQDSNLESSEPKSDVLPVTLSDKLSPNWACKDKNIYLEIGRNGKKLSWQSNAGRLAGDKQLAADFPSTILYPAIIQPVHDPWQPDAGRFAWHDRDAGGVNFPALAVI